jgi:hypothetical protein
MPVPTANAVALVELAIASAPAVAVVDIGSPAVAVLAVFSADATLPRTVTHPNEPDGMAVSAIPAMT